MKKFYLKLSTLLVASIVFTNSVNAQFTQGNIVVYQVGDGSSALTASSAPTFLKEYTIAGAAGISVAMPTTGAARLTASGSASTEGLITLSASGQFIIVPGYDAGSGTATVSSTTSSTVNRVIDTVSFLAIPGRATVTSSFFSANSTRSACSDGLNNYWQTGGSSGTCYTGSGTAAAVSTTVANERGVNIFNNKLYFSTGSGTHGIYQVGAGAPPTTSGNTATNIINSGASGSPQAFEINKTSDVCYVADDQASSAGGIQKWTYNGTSWTLAYTLGTGVTNIGARGVTVDWSTPNPTIYGTSAESSGNRVFKIVDAGAGSSATTLVTASTNTIFRGIVFSPYCTAANITTISSNGPICTGQSLALNSTISGSTPISYNWSGTGSFSSTTVKNPTVTGAASGDYTLTAMNSCGSNSSTISVVVNPLPNITTNATSTLVCSGQPVTLTAGGANTYTWSNGITDGVAFNPTSNNTYTVTGKDLNNCVNTNTITVNVNALPTVTATATQPVVCIGGNTTLTSGGTATSYNWSSGVTEGTPFSPTVTATYTVTGIDGNNCINTATISVAVNNLPNVIANATPTAVCEGNNVTLNGGGAVTYTWSSGATNGVAFTPTITADYTVSGTDANSCVNTATITVTVFPVPSLTLSATSTLVCSGQPVTLTASGANTYTWSNSVNNGVAFNPTSNNTYTVTATGPNSCTNTATIDVNVNSLPAVTANPSPASVCTGSGLTLTGGGAVTYTWSSGVSDGVAFTPNATATYTVTGTDANACVNTATVSVPVNNLPSVTANANPAAVCLGNNLSLTGGGAVTYTWSSSVSDGVAFTPTTTTNYTVTGTDANNCVNTATVNVVVNSLPTIGLTYAPNDTICIGDLVTLNGTGAASYSWTGGVTDGIAFSPSVTVTYTVTGTDLNSCSDTASVQVVVNSCSTGINGNVSMNAINVYPNPAKDLVIIKSEKTINSIKVLNVLGETIYEAELQNTEVNINTNLFAEGNYSIQITTENGVSVKKIVIQK
ncbi:MAG: T9SS type A sorting domain-containing protein [Bacteroidia bacterium]